WWNRARRRPCLACGWTRPRSRCCPPRSRSRRPHRSERRRGSTRRTRIAMTDSPHSFGEPERRNAEALIQMALAEDLGDAGDLTTATVVPARARGSARLVARAPGVVAGLPVVAMLMERFEL